MKQFSLSLFFALCSLLSLSAQNQPDSLKVIELESVDVVSIKSTGAQHNQPVAVSTFSGQAVENITAPTQLSALVPNFFMPNYGSKLTSAIYIRGVGSRMNDSAVGLYVDNVPVLDKSMFDFDFFDIANIELLRGPQGTLYGRNAMAGIMRINTPSPLSHSGTRASLSYGSANSMAANATHAVKIRDNMGISVGANYRQTDGFFTNIYNGKSADELQSAAFRLRFDWRITDRWLLNYIINGEKSEQNGYPYASAETGKINYNDESSYRRQFLLNSLRLRYLGDNFTLESVSSHQYFDDNMKMDQDFRPENLFTLQQKQRQNAFTQEFIVKNNSAQSDYNWLFGAFGFYKQNKTNAPVEFKEQGIVNIIQKALDDMLAANPNAPKITLVEGDRSSEPLQYLLIPSAFKMPAVGASVFHQSTYHLPFVEGLSLTAGLRADYEKITLDYQSAASAWFKVQPPRSPVAIWQERNPNLTGEISTEYFEFLPKFALQYQFHSPQMLYASVAKGYTAGGFNTQLFADLIQNSFRGSNVVEMTESEVKQTVSYEPEHTWNYEIGARGNFFQNRLRADASLFYIDSRNRQIAQFVASGLGREMRNAARSESYGTELSLTGFYENFSVNLAYGYAHATFREYKEETGDKVTDFKGKFVPFAPRHTFSASTAQRIDFERVIDRLTIGLQYIGAGKIYFTEANDISQAYYGLVNADVTAEKGIFSLSLWAKNITDTRYNLFAFYSLNEVFAQQGTPAQVGITARVRF